MKLALDRKGRLKLSERAIEQQIVDALEAHGWRVLRTNKFCSGNAVVVQGATEPGIPDLQARKVGYEHERWDRKLWRIIWIEVKRANGQLGPKQIRWWATHPDEEKRLARCLEEIEDLL